MHSFAQGLMPAEADVIRGVGWVSRIRTGETPNGYQTRGSDTRVGSIGLRISKLRQGQRLPGVAPRSPHGA